MNERSRPWTVALAAAAAAVFAWTVGGLAVAGWRLYITSWDLAIFDQAAWLTAHLQPPYLTTRLMPLWGHHLNLALLPLALLYRLVPGPPTLLWVQTGALVLGAVPLFRLAHRRTGSDLVALGWVLVYFANPALQYLALHDFHFEPLALPCFLCAIEAADDERWRPMAGWLLLAALAKEDAGLAIAGFGATLALLGQRRIGLLTAAAGLGYSVLAIKVILPHFAAGAGPFYLGQYFGHLGDSLPAIALAPLLRPGAVAEALFQPANGRLLLDLLVPLAGLCLLRPKWLLGAAPHLWLNLVGGFWVTHTIHYHYQGFPFPFLFVAAVLGGATASDWLAAHGARPAVARATPVVLALLGTFLIPWLLPGQVSGAPTSPLRQPAQLAAWRADRGWRDEADRLVARIPADASVAASLLLLDHVSGRREAYLFPNPFETVLESLDAEFDPVAFQAGLAAGPVEYVLVRPSTGNSTPLTAEDYAAAVAALAESDRYERIGGETVQLYRRTGVGRSMAKPSASQGD